MEDNKKAVLEVIEVDADELTDFEALAMCCTDDEPW